MAALEQALAKLDAVREHYAQVCKCEWTDDEFSQRTYERAECSIHGTTPDPLDAIATVRAEVGRLVEDLEEERAVSRDRFVGVELLQHQLKEARKPITVQATGGVLFEGMRSRAESAEAKVTQLRQALEEIAKSYPNIRFEDGETITELRPAPTGTGIPTNRRIARETLAALAGSVPATETERADDELCICGHTAGSTAEDTE